jgi:GNAT superfamily N-acetyltransferase
LTHRVNITEDVQLEDLKGHLDCIELIATWHHQEWLKGRELAFNSELEPNDDLDRRCEVLRTHGQNSGLPRTFVALVDGQVVGSVSIVYYCFTKTQTASEWLTNVYVEPRYRRQGFAAKLIEYACEQALNCGVSKLKLYTSDKSAYYQRLGWKMLGVSRAQSQQVSILEYALG